MTIFMYIFYLIARGLNLIAVKIQGTPVSLEGFSLSSSISEAGLTLHKTFVPVATLSVQGI